jgi:hypothetical protein
MTSCQGQTIKPRTLTREVVRSIKKWRKVIRVDRRFQGVLQHTIFGADGVLTHTLRPEFEMERGALAGFGFRP